MRKAGESHQQGDEFLVADVPGEHAREVTERAGMMARLEEHSFDRRSGVIRVEAHPRKGDLSTDVVLVHEEVRNVDTGAVLDCTRSIAVSSGLVPRILATSARVLPIRGLSESLLKATNRTPIGGRGGEEALPVSRVPIAHLEHQASADRGILDPRGPLGNASILDPGRHRGVETGRAGGVRYTYRR